MIGKPFETIKKDDIEALVANAVGEGRNLEYKQLLPGRTDEEVREFLADVSSFANAVGGDLIYGIREQRDRDQKPTGVPDAAEGLVGINTDAEKGRLENIIRDGIDPRIPSVHIKHLEGFSEGPVIVLRISQSWVSPHMVKFKNLSRFFSRNSAGKYQLDVRELRAALLGSQNLADKISAFRSDRVSKIFAGSEPLSTESLPRLVLHLLPTISFSETISLDLKAVQPICTNDVLKPMGYPIEWGPTQFNFNGLFSSGRKPNTFKYDRYVQLFRNGAIEAVTSIPTYEKRLSGSQLEDELMREAPRYIKLQQRLGIGPPLFATSSLVSVKGFAIVTSLNQSPYDFPSNRLIDQDVLVIPEVQLEEEGADFGSSIRPALDTIWQASGLPGSPSFDRTGQWAGSINP